MTSMIAIGVGLSTYTLDLPVGPWYFEMSAINSDGTESARSNVVSKIVD